MTDENFNLLMESLEQAIAFYEGHGDKVRVHLPPDYDENDDSLENLLILALRAHAGDVTDITGMTREERRRALWGDEERDLPDDGA